MSDSSVRGYVERSSWGANWAGLTKIETIVESLWCNDSFTARVQREESQFERNTNETSYLDSPTGPPTARL